MNVDALPHLLVPTNFGPTARLALQRALQLALKQEARVTLLHVSEGPPQWRERTDLDAVMMLHDVIRMPDEGSSYLPTSASQLPLLGSRAMERMEREIHPEWRPAVDVRTVWRTGDVLEQILQFAREERVDAIVLGMRRPCYFRLMPNLGERIMRSAPCEVIVVSVAAHPPPTGWRKWLFGWWMGSSATASRRESWRAAEPDGWTQQLSPLEGESG